MVICEMRGRPRAGMDIDSDLQVGLRFGLGKFPVLVLVKVKFEKGNDMIWMGLGL